MGKKMSGAQKRKKKKEREKAVEEARAEMERLKLGPTKLWTGLVLHHKDIFVSHVLPKLNTTERFFFSEANSESEDVLAYAGVDVSKSGRSVFECTSISTLEWAWNDMGWGEEFEDGTVRDQAWFCCQVAFTNKLELLKWAREVKHCEWDEETINAAARKGNLEMLKYCFSNDCPCDEKKACKQAAAGGNLDCLRFLFDKVEPSRETEKEAAIQATADGHVDILRYSFEERKIPDGVKIVCVINAAAHGRLDCLKYLVEEAKVPINLVEEAKVPTNLVEEVKVRIKHWQYIAYARYYEHPECENYLLEKGCPEPTDEDYAWFVEEKRLRA